MFPEDDLGMDPYWRWKADLSLLNTHHYLEFDKEYAYEIYYDSVIKRLYSDRPYHNLRHIEYMLKYIKDFKNISHKDKVLLRIAIWFHDLVYDPAKSNNKELSADFAANFLTSIGVDQCSIDKVRWMIILTKHVGFPQTQTEDIICDLDLREIASPRFEKNAQEIRLEYGHLNDEEWKKVRSKFLNFMLDKTYIYNTDLYRDTLEEKARYNLEKELRNIKQ